MSNLRGSRVSLRWWLALALATTGIVVVAMVTLASDDPTSGAATPEAAVDSYLEALNHNDAEALRRLSVTSGVALEAGIGRRLDKFGGRDIRLDNRKVENGPAPHQASAVLEGFVGDEPYRERLFMNLVDDRWYINLADVPTETGTPPLPTANISR